MLTCLAVDPVVSLKAQRLCHRVADEPHQPWQVLCIHHFCKDPFISKQLTGSTCGCATVAGPDASTGHRKWARFSALSAGLCARCASRDNSFSAAQRPKTFNTWPPPLAASSVRARALTMARAPAGCSNTATMCCRCTAAWTCAPFAPLSSHSALLQVQGWKDLASLAYTALAALNAVLLGATALVSLAVLQIAGERDAGQAWARHGAGSAWQHGAGSAWQHKAGLAELTAQRRRV